jgi:hypothetical protein
VNVDSTRRTRGSDVDRFRDLIKCLASARTTFTEAEELEYLESLTAENTEDTEVASHPMWTATRRPRGRGHRRHHARTRKNADDASAAQAARTASLWGVPL